jgi:hypothetical protein
LGRAGCRAPDLRGDLEHRVPRHPTGPLGVTVEHRGAERGQAVYLERTQDDSILAIAVVNGIDWMLAPSAPIMFFSPELVFGSRGTDVEVRGVALVERPAPVGLPKVTVIPGDLRDITVQMKWSNRTAHRALMQRAAEACRRRRSGSPLVIEDPSALARRTKLGDGMVVDGRGELVPSEHRGGARYCRTDDGQVLAIEHRPARIIGVR